VYYFECDDYLRANRGVQFFSQFECGGKKWATLPLLGAEGCPHLEEGIQFQDKIECLLA
jgi:hypothetical protein